MAAGAEAEDEPDDGDGDGWPTDETVAAAEGELAPGPFTEAGSALNGVTNV